MPRRVRDGGKTDPGEESAQQPGNLRFHLVSDGSRAGGAEPSKDWHRPLNPRSFRFQFAALQRCRFSNPQSTFRLSRVPQSEVPRCP